ncbi:MAG: FAD-dependent oxidoreductase [Rhodothermales bacterium]
MHVVIIGNGIAGITAARFVRKNGDARLTIVSSETEYHVARTALMYAYMGDLRESDLKPYEDDFWTKNRMELVLDHATDLDTAARSVQLASGRRLTYDRLVLATGSRPNRFGWQGEYLDGVQGLYAWSDLKTMQRVTEGITDAVVVGGGLIGIELVEMLRSRSIDVHFLVRETAYMDHLFSRDESELIHRQIDRHGVHLHLGCEVDRFEDDGNGRVAAVTTRDGRSFPAAFAGIGVGVHPRTELAEAAGIETNKGILVDRSFRTSAPDVFAAGDCAEFRRPLVDGRTIEQLWYSARRQGRILGLILSGKDLSYDTPVFYNSAKFFDLEYQTYGSVPATDDAGLETRAWQDGTRLVRVARRADTGALAGVTGFGIRLRHDVAATWIRAARRATFSGQDVRELAFDPEFTSLPHNDIARELSAWT